MWFADSGQLATWSLRNMGEIRWLLPATSHWPLTTAVSMFPPARRPDLRCLASQRGSTSPYNIYVVITLAKNKTRLPQRTHKLGQFVMRGAWTFNQESSSGPGSCERLVGR